MSDVTVTIILNNRDGCVCTGTHHFIRPGNKRSCEGELVDTFDPIGNLAVRPVQITNALSCQFFGLLLRVSFALVTGRLFFKCHDLPQIIFPCVDVLNLGERCRKRLTQCSVLGTANQRIGNQILDLTALAVVLHDAFAHVLGHLSTGSKHGIGIVGTK